MSVVPVKVTGNAPVSPTVSFTANSPVLAGNPVLFTNISDPGHPPDTEYLWDFGDGKTLTVGTTTPVYKVYATFGTYTVSWKARNVVGCDTLTQDVWFSRGSSSSRCLIKNNFLSKPCFFQGIGL